MAGIYLKVTSDFLPSSTRPRFRDKEPEISVEKGDIIFDVRKLDDGWVYGKNLNTGKAGVFPASCTAKLSGSDDSDTGSETGKEGKNKTAKNPVEELRRPSRRSSGSSQGSTGSTGRKKDPVVNGNDQAAGEPDSKNGAAKEPAESDKTKPSRETLNSRTSQAPTGANLFKKQLSKPNINPASGKEKEKKFGTTEPKGAVSKSTSPEDRSIRDTPARAQLFKLRPISSRISEERMKENKKKEQERQAKEKEDKEKKEKEKKEKEKKEKEKKEKEKKEKEKKEKEKREKEKQDKEKQQKEEREKLQQVKEKPDDKQKVKVDSKPETDKIDIKAEDQLYLNDSPIKKPQLAVDEEDVLESEKPDPHYLNDEPTALSVGIRDQSSTTTPIQAATAQGDINIQENPLTRDDENIYQTPDLGKLPDKPRGGCDECHEPHDYDVPNHYKTPPGSPVTSKKKKEKSKKKKHEKIKLSDMENKVNDTKFANQRHKMASYESIRAGDFAKSSTESVKDAVKAVKKTKENIGTRRYPRLRILGGIALGVLLGIVCFLILYLVIFLAAVTSAVVAFIVGFVAAITFGFLDRTRILCIILLIFPSLFSTGGKIAVWILITYFIIVGPICNTVGNIQIIANSRLCVVLTSNDTLNSSDKYVLSSRMNTLESRLQEKEKTFKELESVINETLLNMNLANFNNNASVNSYTGKHCSRAVNESRVTCLSDAAASFDACTKIFSGSGKEIALREKCQLFKASNICIALLDDRIQQTCHNINLMMAKNSLVEAKYLIENSKQGSDIADEMLASNNILIRSKSEVCGFTIVLEMLLPLLILIVLYEAFRYHKLYMSRNCFDNHYLTKHFKSIDELRKSSRTSDGLLPLKKGELKKYVRPTACQLALVERKNLFKFLFIYFMYFLFALILVLHDYFFFRAVSQGQKLSPDDAKKNVTTSGYPRECSLQLNPPLELYVIILSVLLGVLLLMILLQSHVLRLRRFVTRRFYPRRERKRVAFLYYKILEERRSFVKAVIARINSKVDENEMLKELDVMLVLANHFHAMDWLFTTLRLGTRSCMVCGTSLNNKYIFCENDSCEAVYCRTCFWDLENKCLGCMCGSKAASVLSSDSFRRNDSSV